MECKKCGAGNAPAKKCCERCGSFLEGWIINNVTGKPGYRTADGGFIPADAPEPAQVAEGEISLGDFYVKPIMLSAWKTTDGWQPKYAVRIESKDGPLFAITPRGRIEDATGSDITDNDAALANAMREWAKTWP